jgi:hypothetical protein
VGNRTRDVKMLCRLPLAGVTIKISCSDPSISRGSGHSGRFPPLKTLKSELEKTTRMENSGAPASVR